ncbi:kelch motif-containing protein [Crocinitomicaceae bacterium]|nr:kelch motif-containing protein [Crocinitomicaceae bacterium]
MHAYEKTSSLDFCSHINAYCVRTDKAEYSLNYFAIYDYNLDAFLVIDDSATYNTYDSEGHTVHSYCFLSEKYSFEQFKTDFIALSIADQGVYLLHKGGGTTYLLKNDTLKRHDQSFNHISQYSGSLFCANDHLHFFGGYGLFTEKNYTVRYDTATGEWYKIQTVGAEIPKPRFGCFSKVVEDNLYILGGQRQMNTSKVAQFKDAWKFSAKEKEWEKLGMLVSPIVLQLIEKSYTSCTRSPFVHRGNCLAHLDLLKNKYSYYEDEFFETIDRIISHPTTDELLLVRRASKNQRISCHISSLDELLSYPIEKGVLYEVPVVKESTLGILPWLLLLPGSLLIYFTLLKLSSFKVVHKSHLQNEKSIPPNFFSPLETIAFGKGKRVFGL